MKLPQKRLNFTQACKQWGKERKARKERKHELINGIYYEYPCAKRGHSHTQECLTQPMIDALSEEVYDA